MIQLAVVNCCITLTFFSFFHLGSLPGRVVAPAMQQDHACRRRRWCTAARCSRWRSFVYGLRYNADNGMRHICAEGRRRARRATSLHSSFSAVRILCTNCDRHSRRAFEGRDSNDIMPSTTALPYVIHRTQRAWRKRTGGRRPACIRSTLALIYVSLSHIVLLRLYIHM